QRLDDAIRAARLAPVDDEKSEKTAPLLSTKLHRPAVAPELQRAEDSEVHPRPPLAGRHRKRIAIRAAQTFGSRTTNSIEAPSNGRRTLRRTLAQRPRAEGAHLTARKSSPLDELAAVELFDRCRWRALATIDGLCTEVALPADRLVCEQGGFGRQ